ncbi:MAG: N-acetyltransferase [Candidatus Eisenbacteria bacterium]|uniref:N-acetyltransferase n=1 Tax=Eiseniibacteriota bacterium TaxID=2212470 RepID=A0A948RU59_UNCEI|nr:N-acetyltransferase [Candidatus Eisenbacteria bacterium]MBU1949702.1 N-acetyltransferase [Candidatus Eisenbacteria bacterium]MBU2689522.1 N-acetyltransferase [Candidatus Eisenbacteria bacterium]
MAEVFVHAKGINESDDVGSGTRIWAHAHVMKGAKVGRDCNIGDGAFIETGAVLGNCVTVKNGVSVWDRVTCEDYVFLGPNAVLTNDPVPRSHPDYKGHQEKWLPTLLCEGTTIGANATIICGTTLGRWCFVGAGAVVVRNVPSHGLVVGNPAHQIGWVCRCGQRLPENLTCSCGKRYRKSDGGLRPAE